MRDTAAWLDVAGAIAEKRRQELIQARWSAVLAVKRFTNGELPPGSTFRRTCNACHKEQDRNREVNKPCEYCGCNVVLWQ